MNAILRRIEKLEQEMRRSVALVTCTMADGPTRKVRASRLLDMVGECVQGLIKPDTQILLDSISDDGAAAGEGYLTDLVRVMNHARTQHIGDAAPAFSDDAAGISARAQ